MAKRKDSCYIRRCIKIYASSNNHRQAPLIAVQNENTKNNSPCYIYLQCIYSYCCEACEYDCSENISDNFKSLEPDHIVPSESLECAPEAVSKVEPESSEPYKVNHYIVPVSESCCKEKVRILCMCTHKFFELHVCPEMGKVESKDAENDYTEYNHVLRCPRISFCLACYSIAVVSSASFKVAASKYESVDDVDNETKCKNRNHYSHNRE